MNRIREVVVELLRHGPAHNQLLSPLTDYLALVGDHGAETLNVPFEHHQFLHRLRALNYEKDKEDRLFQLEELGRIVSDMFGRMPGLIASLADQSGTAPELPLHLRLMLSSSELSLLPFELANMPSGVPGAGKPLVLQSLRPVCLTRRVRRVVRKDSYWSGRPRILFAAAAPPDVARVPVKEHLLALREAVNPWIACDEERGTEGNEGERIGRMLSRHLVFVANASLDELEAVCKTNRFTHVHILAHGIETSNSEGLHYGLAFHDRSDPSRTDLVSGERLAAALTVFRREAGRGRSAPVMVTIASCYGAQQGSVVGAGASVAHQLHEAGIPMVVASQFPLSVPGSVLMTRLLYKRLLWGTDPRVALTDLRGRLFALLPEQHDWASLVVYDSFPEDLDDIQARIGIQQANASIRAALNCADRALFTGDGEKRLDQAGKERLDQALDSLEERTRHLEELIDLAGLEGTTRTDALGMLASAEKRQAQVRFHLSKMTTEENDTPGRHAVESLALLEQAMENYSRIFLIDKGSHWAITQYLSLYAVLDQLANTLDHRVVCRYEPETLLSAARLAAQIDLTQGSAMEKVWALGSLAELSLLEILLKRGKVPVQGQEKNAKATGDYLEQMLTLPDVSSRSLYATVHQFRRYWDWYAEICSGKFAEKLKGFQDAKDMIESIQPEAPQDY